jgi:toxin-antitoxin system PIN domain toxin
LQILQNEGTKGLKKMVFSIGARWETSAGGGTRSGAPTDKTNPIGFIDENGGGPGVRLRTTRLRKSRDVGLKKLVNDVLRRGLENMALSCRVACDCRSRGIQVILVDANLLIYARVESFAQHKSAHAWLDRQLNGSTRVGMPWESLIAFLRLVTNTRVFERAESVENAWKQVRAWISCDVVWIPQPTERHAELLDGLLTRPGVQANLVPDAHLAALALEHGLTLCSTDGDFARFLPSLRWQNPIS